MKDQGNREKEIYAKASEIESVRDRACYLQGVCGDDIALKSRVEALLKANEESGRFLPSEPTVLLQPMFGDQSGRGLRRIAHGQLQDGLGTKGSTEGQW